MKERMLEIKAQNQSREFFSNKRGYKRIVGMVYPRVDDFEGKKRLHGV